MTATTLHELKKALNPRPLKAEELKELFVETSAARDPTSSRRLEIAEHLEADEPIKVLLAGHPGSGKSTELVKLCDELGDRFAVARLSAIEDGDPGSNTIEVILVLIVEAVLKALYDVEIHLPDERIRPIEQWFAKTFDIDESKLDFSARTGAGMDSSASVWSKLLGITAYLKADIRAGSVHLRKTVHEKESRLPELTKHCRDLVQDAQLELHALEKELLVIVEDLDKAQIDEATHLFIENPIPLASLPTKAIFTAPIFLLSNTRVGMCEPYFKTVTIPMIKVEGKNGKKDALGWRTIESILTHRIDMEAGLIEQDAIHLAIEKTGGVLRHLFEALHYAAMASGQAARDGRRQSEEINKDDVRYGLNRVRGNLIRKIGTVGLPEEFREITTDHLYERLLELRGRAERVRSDDVNLLLLQAHALLEYNGEQWHRVHPLVDEHLEETQHGAA